MGERERIRKNVHLVWGDDNYNVEARARRLAESIVPAENRTLGLEIIDGRADRAEDAVEAIRRCVEAVCTVSLASGVKLVWLRNASFLAGNEVGRAKSADEALAELVKALRGGLPGGHVLLVTAPEVSESNPLVEACAELGTVEQLVLPRKAYQAERHATAQLMDMAKERGVRMSAETARTFIRMVGTDYQRIAAELEKLATYVGGGAAVGDDELRSVVNPLREAVAWDMADAFGRSDLADALVGARRCLTQGESAIGLLVLLEDRVRDLILYRQALDSGWLAGGGSVCGAVGKWSWSDVPEEVGSVMSEGLGADPRRAHPYRVHILAEQAQNFTMDKLLACLQKIIEAHEKAVSTSLSEATIIETMLVDALACGFEPQGSGGTLRVGRAGKGAT